MQVYRYTTQGNAPKSGDSARKTASDGFTFTVSPAGKGSITFSRAFRGGRGESKVLLHAAPKRQQGVDVGKKRIEKDPRLHSRITGHTFRRVSLKSNNRDRANRTPLERTNAKREMRIPGAMRSHGMQRSLELATTPEESDRPA